MSDEEIDLDHCGMWWSFDVMRRVGKYLVVAVVALTIGVLVGCGVPAETSDSTPDATLPATTNTVADVGILPAETDVPAVRGTSAVLVEVAPPPVPAFDPVAYVNGLDYGWTEMGPAMEAYRVVALSRGWPQWVVDKWAPFVFDVIAKESGGCWNLQGGDIPFPGTCHEFQQQGNGEDSGHAQLTSAIWGRNADLCKLEGYCSAASVLASPWASMDAAVASFEIYGRYPWCDYEGVPVGFHNCSLIGRHDRPLP